MGATRLRRIASAALYVPVLLIAACSSGPRTPAPIVDRSNKAPPVVIVSSVGQAKAPTPATPQASPQARGPAPQPRARLHRHRYSHRSRTRSALPDQRRAARLERRPTGLRQRADPGARPRGRNTAFSS
ncbi:MAG: hypothetical protein EBX55_10615, partial [Betaproteobacteria bacterium]|nr:hypothetical protein [Betaproteobacteria bacterium]